MALSDQDKQFILEAINENACTFCRDHPDMAEELPHMMGAVKDVGEGSLANGVEELRSNAKFTKDLRGAMKTTKVTTLRTLVRALVLAIVAGLILLFSDKVLRGP